MPQLLNRGVSGSRGRFGGGKGWPFSWPFPFFGHGKKPWKGSKGHHWSNNGHGGGSKHTTAHSGGGKVIDVAPHPKPTSSVPGIKLAATTAISHSTTRTRTYSHSHSSHSSGTHSHNTSFASAPTAATEYTHGTRKVKIAAIVVPLLVVLACIVTAFVLLRRRQLKRNLLGAQLPADGDGDGDDASVAPTKSARTRFAFRGIGLILPPRRGAALRPQRAITASPLAGMMEDNGSRPVSVVSSVFDFRNPFSSRSAIPDSTINFATSSVGTQLGHEHEHVRVTLASERYSTGTSVSGSIVGSGMFSLASAHHGHSSAANVRESADPFADTPARPYSASAWTDGDDASRSSWNSQIGYDRTSGASDIDAFIPGVDAPPVPHHETPLPPTPTRYEQMHLGPDAPSVPIAMIPMRDSIAAPSSAGAVAHFDGSSVTSAEIPQEH